MCLLFAKLSIRQCAVEFLLKPFYNNDMKPTSRSVKNFNSTDKGSKTREKILKSALKVFSEKGYHPTNVEEIVEKSGTSKGGFYFHFPSKKELFNTLIDEMLGVLLTKIEIAVSEKTDIAEQIEAALDKTFQVFTKYRSLAKFLLVEAVSSGNEFEKTRFASYSRFARFIQQLLEQAITEGRIEPVDTGVVAWCWVGSINQILIRWLYLEEGSLEQDLKAVKGLLIKSIGLKRRV